MTTALQRSKDRNRRLSQQLEILKERSTTSTTRVSELTLEVRELKKAYKLKKRKLRLQYEFSLTSRYETEFGAALKTWKLECVELKARVASSESARKKLEKDSVEGRLRLDNELLRLKQANERLALEKATIEERLAKQEELIHRLSHRDALALVQNDKLRRYYLKVSKVLSCQ